LIRLAVTGAAGKMGRAMVRGILEQADIEIVVAVDPAALGKDLGTVAGKGRLGLVIAGDLETALKSCEADVDVLLDFTVADVSERNIEIALKHNLNAVVGTTGLREDFLLSVGVEAESRGLAVANIPNFSIGAFFLGQFAQMAARVYEMAEIVEMHHETKRDAPSGTARSYAEKIQALTKSQVPIHSLRLPGYIAVHEIHLGGPGETLVLRHGSTDRESFLFGVLLALRRIDGMRGLIKDLSPFLPEELGRGSE